jgi:hypothetical protein
MKLLRFELCSLLRRQDWIPVMLRAQTQPKVGLVHGEIQGGGLVP